MKTTLILFTTAALYILLSVYPGNVSAGESFKQADSCKQHITLVFQRQGQQIIFQGDVMAIEYMDTMWSIYIDGQRAFWLHRDSVKSLNMIY